MKRRRSNQILRTRKALLQAGARLMAAGHVPRLEEIAAEAMVSRATAYRYFSSVEELLREAALDVALPAPEALFPASASNDPLVRLERLDRAMQAMIEANELSLRMMLANSLLRRAQDSAAPARQNRRVPLIEAALEPARKQFRPGTREMLTRALALVLGTESMVVFKDVLQLDDAEAGKVRRWVMRALVNAAKNQEHDAATRRRPGA